MTAGGKTKNVKTAAGGDDQPAISVFSILSRLYQAGGRIYREGYVLAVIPPDEVQLVLSEDEEKALFREGWKITYGAWAACGYAALDRRQEDGTVKYTLTPCFCHPNNYAIMVEKKLSAIELVEVSARLGKPLSFSSITEAREWLLDAARELLEQGKKREIIEGASDLFITVGYSGARVELFGLYLEIEVDLERRRVLATAYQVDGEGYEWATGSLVVSLPDDFCKEG